MKYSLSVFARSVAALCVSLWFAACTHTTTPSSHDPNALDSSVIVVNQGAFGRDNATLSRIDRRNDSVQNNWFTQVNSSMKLGATANDVVFKGDTAFISITESHALEVINAKSGKHISTLHLSSTDKPWMMSIINPTLGVVSTTTGDGIQFFNPTSLTLLDRVSTGPATQGVCVAKSRVYVANSGYGTVRAHEPGAGTVSVVDIASRTVVATLQPGKNVTEVVASSDGSKVYAYYQELYTNVSALQGVVEYDVATNTELRRWEFPGLGFLQIHGSTLYVIAKKSTSDAAWSVMSIDLGTTAPEPTSVMTLPSNVWPNGFRYHARDASVWISDAVDFTSNGRVLLYSSSGALHRSYAVGLNPGTIAFYH